MLFQKFRAPAALSGLLFALSPVTVELDARLRFPVPTASDLPLVKAGAATDRELVTEGASLWFRDAPLEGEPFGIPERLFDGYFGAVTGKLRDVLSQVLESWFQTGIIMIAGEDLPRGIVRSNGGAGAGAGFPIVTQNCSACHSGVVNGHLIPGIANKTYDQKALISASRSLLSASLPLLKARGDGARELYEQSRLQLAELDRYDALYGGGCTDLGPGMVTAARIWEISSKMLHDPSQVATPEGVRQFPCGSTKPPALNTLRFRNLFFWDGSVNTLWVAHWPMFDFFGFDDYERWKRKVQTRSIQAMDAFLEFGLESPSWGEVMKTPIRRELADRGFRLFHRERSCASCHGTYSREGMLERFKPAIIPLDEIRTDPERAVAASDELLSRFQQYGWAFVPRLSGLGKDYPLGYQATPLCSPFLNFPYLHTAGVASLDELLLSEERRSRVFRVSEQVDEEHVGYFVHGSGRARHVSERALRGHSGERYGSDLGAGERAELVEYLKTLRCPM